MEVGQVTAERAVRGRQVNQDVHLSRGLGVR